MPKALKADRRAQRAVGALAFTVVVVVVVASDGRLSILLAVRMPQFGRDGEREKPKPAELKEEEETNRFLIVLIDHNRRNKIVRTTMADSTLFLLPF